MSNLQRGDILLNELYHTEIYLGNNQNVGAHSDRGYPQTGDQTGTEVSVSGYYYHPWDGVLRYVGSNVCTCSTSYAGDYTVTTSSLPLTMRSGHGTGYSTVTSIPKGSKVYVSRANGSWAHVEWNGYSGYCSMSYLTKITSTSYNLHVWVSDSAMGDVPTGFVKGKRYYICYELTDTSTGKKANEISSMNYNATETVRNSDGKVFQHTYEKSDYNWISVVCDSEDTYTGTVTISGDVNISCSISFEVYADTAPQVKVWAWETDDTQEISTIAVGKTAYCSYLIRDKYTTKNLNDVTTYWTQGNGYTVTVKVYDPSGSLIRNKSYKNNDCTWFSFVPEKIGEYKIKISVSGNLSGGYERTITAEEKEHIYGSWTVTRTPTCVQPGTKVRTCSICGTKETQSIEMKSHSYDNGTITEPATCEEAGTKTYSCKTCPMEKEEAIPALGHTEVIDKAVEPTYTQNGLSQGKHCAECGKVLVAQEYIPPLEYVPEDTQTPEPTEKPSEVKPTTSPVIEETPEPADTPVEEDLPTATPDMNEEITLPTYPPMSGEVVLPTHSPVIGGVIRPSNPSAGVVIIRPSDSSAEKEEAVPTSSPTAMESEDSSDFSDDVDVPVAGSILLDVKRGIIYEVIVPGKCVAVDGVINRMMKKLVIPNTISFSGVTYQVTEISNNAFKECKRLKKVTVGKNVANIGNKAFYGCKKLKRVTIKSKRLKKDTVGKKAFGGTNKKIVIKVPQKQMKKYAKWLKKIGKVNGKIVV